MLSRSSDDTAAQISSPRLRPKLHSITPISLATPLTSRPRCFSSTGVHGTSAKPKSLSIMANRPARRRHLAVEVEVRAAGEHQGRPGIVGTAEPAHLDNAAGGRCLSKGFDPAEAYIVGAAVDAVDHRIRFAGQLIMQPALDNAPNDRRRRRAAVDHVIGNAAVLAALGEGAMHGLDDIAAHAEIAQGRLRREIDDPLTWPSRRRQPHALQFLQPPDGEPPRLGVALARKLLVALWRYLEAGLVPTGAVFKAR
jgi:hypothetical protein